VVADKLTQKPELHGVVARRAKCVFDIARQLVEPRQLPRRKNRGGQPNHRPKFFHADPDVVNPFLGTVGKCRGIAHGGSGKLLEDGSHVVTWMLGSKNGSVHGFGLSAKIWQFDRINRIFGMEQKAVEFRAKDAKHAKVRHHDLSAENAGGRGKRMTSKYPEKHGDRRGADVSSASGQATPRGKSLLQATVSEGRRDVGPTAFSAFAARRISRQFRMSET
jgi:hypothetical protein